MRLLNTHTRQFEEFFDNEIPQYAILSHRWEGDEVSYSDYLNRTTKIKARKGYDKITKFCKLSENSGYSYAWIDTCCIDKRSSAELSEAINAMYRWYRDADICFTYLSDVGRDDEFESSGWFTRGWTLQELLAPERMEFRDRNWNFLFTRDDAASRIAAVTKIHPEAIAGGTQHGRREFLNTRSVAQKMAWASRRVTSRAEDIAYCLLGLFGINMSLLYGEGAFSAFRRLQLEIMSKTDDETIFAWSGASTTYNASLMLASNPARFQDCHHTVPISYNDHGYGVLTQRKPYIVTNKGLYMQIHVITVPDEGLLHEFCFPLRCTIQGDMRTQPRYPIVIRVVEEPLKWVEAYHRSGMSEPGAKNEDESVLTQLQHLKGCPKKKIYLRI